MLLPLPCVCQMMPPWYLLTWVLRSLHADILVHARQLLYAAVEQHKIVEQFDEPLLAAHLEQVLIELEPAVIGFVLFPFQEVLFGSADRPVTQAFGVIAGENDLDGGEEPFIEFGPLVGQQLADAVADRHVAVLQFDHRQSRCR